MTLILLLVLLDISWAVPLQAPTTIQSVLELEHDGGLDTGDEDELFIPLTIEGMGVVSFLAPPTYVLA